jgi:hypothetical protein
MTIQLSDAVRNAMADAYETAIGTAPTIEIRTGSPPANCAAADSGSLLATITNPSDWLTAASSGSKSKSGTWSIAASGTGTTGHYRIKQGATCHEQGTITATGGGGDMTVDNTSVASGQTVTVTSFTRTMPGG